MSRKALVFQGGWDGHQPKEVSAIFARILREAGFEVEVSDTLDALADGEKLKSLSLIVPMWTMGKIDNKYVWNIIHAVESGVGLAGIHGGMCDAFRDSSDWLFLTGGQFAAHPGNDGTKHRIHLGPNRHEITAGIADFDVATEQYYMLVDPANNVLAYSEFPNHPSPHDVNGPVKMPVIWTRGWGKGRIFYSSLGHHADVVEAEPHLTLLRRGFLWAARA
jgi:type 1 glutamine amidotransferase